jgi:hypothetical protein
MAPRVSAMMAKELGRDETWQTLQKSAFEKLAHAYIINAGT